MTDFALRLLLLLRLLCFMALVYLALHAICARLIARPDSKVLWFFSVLTAPLTWPVRTWMPLNAPEPRLRLWRWLSIACSGHSLLWRRRS